VKGEDSIGPVNTGLLCEIRPKAFISRRHLSKPPPNVESRALNFEEQATQRLVREQMSEKLTFVQVKRVGEHEHLAGRISRRTVC
jgi:hypothetical protein